MLPKVGEGYELWSLGEGDDGDREKGDVFGIEDKGIEGIKGIERIDRGQEMSEEITELKRKEQELLATLKGFNGVVLFTLTSSCDMDESDFRSAILSFRRYTVCTGDVIFSRIYEPNLEPNLIVAALLILGYEGKKVSHKKSFLSGLAFHFPFMFSVFGKRKSQPYDNPSAYSDSKPSLDSISASDNENMSLHLANSLEAKFEDKESAHSIRESNHNNKNVGGDSSEISCESEKTFQTNGDSGVLRDYDSNFSVGPGYHIAQLWAKE